MWQKALFVIVLILLVPVSAFGQNNSKYLSYQNDQYGFSIQYPSSWVKNEQLSKDRTFPNMIDIVTFQSSTKFTQYGIMLIKDDTTYQGLSGQKFLDKMKSEFGGAICSSATASGATCIMKSLTESTITHQNGYAGYMMGLSFTISSDKGQSHPVILLGVYPDGNDIWVLTLLAFSQDEFNQFSDDLTTMGKSFMINNYHGVKATQTQTQKTTAQSSFGVIQINSGVFSTSKYSSDTMIVSGEVNGVLRATPITLKIIKPDNTTNELTIFVKKDGSFSTPVIINNWPPGSYVAVATYGDNEIGTVYFQVISGNTQSTPQNTIITQNPTTLSYTNNEYQISIQYPSILEKRESSAFFPNGIGVVNFATSSQQTGLNIEFIKNDSTFSGLSGSEFLKQMKDQYEANFCKYFEEINGTCSIQVISEGEEFTSKNGYVGFRAGYLFTISSPIDNSQLNMILLPIMFPMDNGIWVLTAGSYSGEEMKSLGKYMDNMLDTFTISDYHKPHLVFNSKAIQKDDAVYLVIKNPATSLNKIYSIKLTSNNKIINFIKIDGWTQQRLDSNSVIYQTGSSPINPSDIFKVKLKVDGKNSDIQWEVFSKDQKSLSKGRTMT
ncbi:MAG TPA: hypothetical protein VLD64_07705 [Nitrosarchaeum sp.]|nr:hypothetical protein [Nitrosarchaeum sp.]